MRAAGRRRRETCRSDGKHHPLPGRDPYNRPGCCRHPRTLADRAGTASCGGVVKADGYGLGAAEIASALSDAGCRHFFVATIDEGIALRKSMPGDAIIVFDGLMAAEGP